MFEFNRIAAGPAVNDNAGLGIELARFEHNTRHMFIPLYSDGPIYHWPIATVILIVANIVAFPIQMNLPPGPIREIELGWADDESSDSISNFMDVSERDGKLYLVVREPGWERFALSHGEGIRPIQWLTSFFMHGSLGHLLGNMVFLWVFGLLIESRVGSIPFTALYLSMGIAQNAVEQIAFLAFPSIPSLGASGAIYSVMALGMLWTPQDNIKCFTMFFFSFFFFDVPALLFGALYLIWDFGIAMFGGFEMSSALLHVIGAATGLAVAVIGIKFDWFNFENRDLWSMFREAAGKEVVARPKIKTRTELAEESEAREEAEQKVALLWRSIDMHITAGQTRAALTQMRHLKRILPGAAWDEARLIKLIALANKAHDADMILLFGDEYLQRFQQKANQIRLIIAKTLALDKDLPRKALGVLSGLDSNELDDQQKANAARLQAICHTKITDGDFELQ